MCVFNRNIGSLQGQNWIYLGALYINTINDFFE